MRADDELRRAALKLISELFEPLTAISLYIEAGRSLHKADNGGDWSKLGELFDKSAAQTKRMNELIRRLRGLLASEEDILEE